MHKISSCSSDTFFSFLTMIYMGEHLFPSRTLGYVSESIKYLTVQMNIIFQKHLGILEAPTGHPHTFLGT